VYHKLQQHLVAEIRNRPTAFRVVVQCITSAVSEVGPVESTPEVHPTWPTAPALCLPTYASTLPHSRPSKSLLSCPPLLKAPSALLPTPFPCFSVHSAPSKTRSLSLFVDQRRRAACRPSPPLVAHTPSISDAGGAGPTPRPPYPMVVHACPLVTHLGSFRRHPSPPHPPSRPTQQHPLSSV
jgi:hypothetical protein